jgi:hypothetical protein
MEKLHEANNCMENKIVCFGQEITGNGSQTQKLSWVRVLVKMLGLEIIFSMIYKDTYRMIRPMVSFRVIKIDKKYKNLSNFPAVTLLALF